MLYCQEVNEILYNKLQDRYDSLPTEVKNTLKSKPCNKCDKELPNQGKVHYVVLSNGKVMWWHDECVTFRRKKHE